MFCLNDSHFIDILSRKYPEDKQTELWIAFVQSILDNQECLKINT